MANYKKKLQRALVQIGAALSIPRKLEILRKLLYPDGVIDLLLLTEIESRASFASTFLFLLTQSPELVVELGVGLSIKNINYRRTPFRPYPSQFVSRVRNTDMLGQVHDILEEACPHYPSLREFALHDEPFTLEQYQHNPKALVRHLAATQDDPLAEYIRDIAKVVLQRKRIPELAAYITLPEKKRAKKAPENETVKKLRQAFEMGREYENFSIVAATLESKLVRSIIGTILEFCGLEMSHDPKRKHIIAPIRMPAERLDLPDIADPISLA
jgi:hypothetical protein